MLTVPLDGVGIYDPRTGRRVEEHDLRKEANLAAQSRSATLLWVSAHLTSAHNLACTEICIHRFTALESGGSSRCPIWPFIRVFGDPLKDLKAVLDFAKTLQDPENLRDKDPRWIEFLQSGGWAGPERGPVWERPSGEGSPS